MLRDVKSNVAMLVGHTPASRSGASGVASDIINMGQYLTGSFIVNTGVYTGSGALAGKLQYSSSSSFGSDVNDDDGSTGNTTAVASIPASSATRFHIKQPVSESKPYYRLLLTDSVAAVIYSSEFVGIPKVTPVSYS